MARRFLDDIRTEITTRIPDNDVGAIDAADVRTPVLDLIDSVVTDEATLDVDIGKTGLAVGTSFVTYADYDSSAGDDANFLKINQAGGFVQGTSTAGFSYLMVVSMSAIFAANRVLDIAVGVNGVETGFIASSAGQGVGDPVFLTTTFFVRSAGSNDDFSLVWKADAATTVDVTDARLTTVIWPTNNP